jgi:hypothetical protein
MSAGHHAPSSVAQIARITIRSLPLALLALGTMSVEGSNPDPFAFFRPSIVISADDRGQLDRGEPLVRVLPGQDLEVAVVAAVPVDVDGDRLVRWMRNIAELKKSPYVAAIGRFSDPPRLDDLAGLSLDDQDLSSIRQCRPGDCDLKLTGAEIGEMQRVIAAAGSEWKAALQDAVRRLVLRRVQIYLEGGHAAMSPYEDRDRPVSLDSRFGLLIRHSSFLSGHLPEFAEYLGRYPQAPMPGVESFVYWSKERLSSKAIVSATHVNILRRTGEGLPDALVAGKEIFATHYVNASLGVTAIVGGEQGSNRYLVYVNRSEVDVLGGFFGGVVRWFMERRLKGEASDVLRGLRLRLEGGEPPMLMMDDARARTGTRVPQAPR